MFLFEGYFGRILYTGDFRYQPSMITDSILSSCGVIDRLFLDNTYNNAKCVWPNRMACTKQIIYIIKQYPAYEIVIGTHKLGKEELLVQIALAFKMKIVVTPDRLRTLKILQMPDVFTTDSSESRIRAVPNHVVTKKNLAQWQEGAPTIAILPTALYTSLESQPFAGHPDIHIIPYSDHSSYPELLEFVSHIKPRAVTPVVGACKMVMGNNDMAVFDPYLRKTGVDSAITIPESVMAYMNSGSVSTPHSLAQACIKGDNVRTKGRKLRNTQGWKRPSKECPKGVVFDDGEEEDVDQEMERRKQCEEQTQLMSNSGSGEDVDKNPANFSDAQNKLFDQLHKACDNIPQHEVKLLSNNGSSDVGEKCLDTDVQHRKPCNELPKWFTKCKTSQQQSSEKAGSSTTFNRVSETCEQITILKSSNRSSSSESETLKPPVKRKMDVLTMLQLSAARRNASKASCQDDEVIIEKSIQSKCKVRKLNDSAQNCGKKRIQVEAEVHNSFRNSSHFPVPESVNIVEEQLLEKDNESILLQGCRKDVKLDKDNVETKLRGRPRAATPQCSSRANQFGLLKLPGSVKKRGKKEVTGQNNQSGLLQLPGSVRKRNKEERPLDLTKIYEKFLKSSSR